MPVGNTVRKQDDSLKSIILFPIVNLSCQTDQKWEMRLKVQGYVFITSL